MRFYLRLVALLILSCISIYFYIYAGLWEIVQQTPFAYFTYSLEIDMESLLTNLTRNPPINTVEPINKNPFEFIHKPSDPCSDRTTLLILIKSSTKNYPLRLMLRTTWLDKLKDIKSISTVFLLGGTSNKTLQESIDAEYAKYGDIIQQNFRDSYFNNTYKTMMAFQIAATKCSQAKYALFVDDDYYIKYERLEDLLENMNYKSETLFMAGYVFSYSMPKRSPYSKWYISLNEYPFSSWPPFITGGAIIVSMPAVIKIMMVMPYTKYLRFDDVFLGIIAWKLNIKLEHIEHFRASKSIFYSWGNNIAYHADNNPETLQTLWINDNT